MSLYLWWKGGREGGYNQNDKKVIVVGSGGCIGSSEVYNKLIETFLKLLLENSYFNQKEKFGNG